MSLFGQINASSGDYREFPATNLSHGHRAIEIFAPRVWFSGVSGFRFPFSVSTREMIFVAIFEGWP